MFNALTYPVKLEKHGDCVIVTFPDLKGANTFGADRAEALRVAQNCLHTWLSEAILEKRDIPVPSKPDGRPTVSAGAMIAAKVALNQVMGENRISNVALAKRLGCDEVAVRHMRNPRRATKITRIEKALSLLGVQLIVTTQKRAA